MCVSACVCVCLRGHLSPQHDSCVHASGPMDVSFSLVPQQESPCCRVPEDFALLSLLMEPTLLFPRGLHPCVGVSDLYAFPIFLRSWHAWNMCSFSPQKQFERKRLQISRGGPRVCSRGSDPQGPRGFLFVPVRKEGQNLFL